MTEREGMNDRLAALSPKPIDERVSLLMAVDVDHDHFIRENSGQLKISKGMAEKFLAALDAKENSDGK